MEIVSASDIQMDYMKLLITQLRNQNPLEPIDNNDMASQLAQFSQLQQLELVNSNLNGVSSSFAAALEGANRNYATSLLGKTVTFFAEEQGSGQLKQMIGTVDSVYTDPETGQNLLGVKTGAGNDIQEYTLSLGAIVLVQN
ncbi:MAG: flagellar hook capping FlgD N-terminal domain-containing protein [Phycisphaerae bacterium]